MSNIVRRLSKSLPAPPPLLSRAKSKRPESVEHPGARDSEAPSEAAEAPAPASAPELFERSAPPAPHRQSSREVAAGLVAPWLDIADDEARAETFAIVGGIQDVLGAGLKGVVKHLDKLERDPASGAHHCLAQLSDRLPARLVYAFERVAAGDGARAARGALTALPVLVDATAGAKCGFGALPRWAAPELLRLYAWLRQTHVWPRPGGSLAEKWGVPPAKPPLARSHDGTPCTTAKGVPDADGAALVLAGRTSAKLLAMGAFLSHATVAGLLDEAAPPVDLSWFLTAEALGGAAARCLPWLLAHHTEVLSPAFLRRAVSAPRESAVPFFHAVADQLLPAAALPDAPTAGTTRDSTAYYAAVRAYGRDADLAKLDVRKPSSPPPAVAVAAAFGDDRFVAGRPERLGAPAVLVLALKAVRDADVAVRVRAFLLVRAATLHLAGDGGGELTADFVELMAHYWVQGGPRDDVRPEERRHGQGAAAAGSQARRAAAAAGQGAAGAAAAQGGLAGEARAAAAARRRAGGRRAAPRRRPLPRLRALRQPPQARRAPRRGPPPLRGRGPQHRGARARPGRAAARGLLRVEEEAAAAAAPEARAAAGQGRLAAEAAAAARREAAAEAAAAHARQGQAAAAHARQGREAAAAHARLPAQDAAAAHHQAVELLNLPGDPPSTPI